MSILQLRRVIKSLPFAAYTPTIAAGSGTFTSVSATGRWCQFGKMVFAEVAVTITTNGTAATYVSVTLPTAASAVQVSPLVAGRENAVSGKGIIGTLLDATHVALFNYDNSYPGASGAVIGYGVIFEAA